MFIYNGIEHPHLTGSVVQRADGFMATLFCPDAYVSELPTGASANGLLTGSLCITTSGAAYMFNSTTKAWDSLDGGGGSAGGGALIVDVLPDEPIANTIYILSTDWTMHVYYEEEWVDVGGKSPYQTVDELPEEPDANVIYIKEDNTMHIHEDDEWRNIGGFNNKKYFEFTYSDGSTRTVAFEDVNEE